MAVDRFPVEAGHVMMFARAIGDPNPVYYDEEYARTPDGWRSGATGDERILCAELHPGRLRHELVRRLRRAK